MSINSRVKGSKGELEVAKVIMEYGYEAKRAQQHSGAAGDEDVLHNIPGVYIEVKLYKECQFFFALFDDWKAKVIFDSRDRPAGTLKVIVHRWNGQTEWYCYCFGQPNGPFSEGAILRFRDFLMMKRRGEI